MARVQGKSDAHTVTGRCPGVNAKNVRSKTPPERACRLSLLNRPSRSIPPNAMKQNPASSFGNLPWHSNVFAAALFFCIPLQAQHLWWNLEKHKDATCLYGQITVLAINPGIYY